MHRHDSSPAASDHGKHRRWNTPRSKSLRSPRDSPRVRPALRSRPPCLSGSIPLSFTGQENSGLGTGSLAVRQAKGTVAPVPFTKYVVMYVMSPHPYGSPVRSERPCALVRKRGLRFKGRPRSQRLPNGVTEVKAPPSVKHRPSHQRNDAPPSPPPLPGRSTSLFCI